VNGPNATARVQELLTDRPPRPCASKSLERFDRAGTEFVDDMRVSANTEPAIDFTATGLLAFALIG
jgi:endoglucanase